MKSGKINLSYSMRIIISNSIFVCNILLLIFLLKFPREVLSASRDGLMLWFNNVLPALLPFIVVVNILVAMGFVETISRIFSPFMRLVFKLPGAGGFALITGLISGYPMGAKTIADLWGRGEITTKEAQRLLAFCNNAGPLFIVGVVGVGLLENSTAGYVLWAGHVAAALIIGIITRGQINGNISQINDGQHSKGENGVFWTKKRFTKKNEMPNFGKVLGDAVKNAMEALVLVGGLIIFFTVVVRVITVIIGEVPYIGVLAGAIEVTGGVKLLADASAGVISPASMAVIGGVIAFGGFSVHAQALHFTSGTGIKAGVYILYKILNGVVAAGLTWLLWHFIYP